MFSIAMVEARLQGLWVSNPRLSAVPCELTLKKCNKFYGGQVDLLCALLLSYTLMRNYINGNS